MDNNLEKDLISKCRDGDQNAFRILANNYRQKLFGYCLRMSGNSLAAEDLFQEILIKVWKGIKKYNEQQKFSNWLFAIAHNTIQDFFRKQHRKNMNEVITDLTGISNSETPHSSFVLTEEKIMMMKAVMNLPDKQREVFLLRQQSNITFKEIAAITNEPLNTVLSSMNYAVKKSKNILRYNMLTNNINITELFETERWLYVDGSLDKQRKIFNGL